MYSHACNLRCQIQQQAADIASHFGDSGAFWHNIAVDDLDGTPDPCINIQESHARSRIFQCLRRRHWKCHACSSSDACRLSSYAVLAVTSKGVTPYQGELQRLPMIAGFVPGHWCKLKLVPCWFSTCINLGLESWFSAVCRYLTETGSEHSSARDIRRTCQTRSMPISYACTCCTANQGCKQKCKNHKKVFSKHRSKMEQPVHRRHGTLPSCRGSAPPNRCTVYPQRIGCRIILKSCRAHSLRYIMWHRYQRIPVGQASHDGCKPRFIVKTNSRPVPFFSCPFTTANVAIAILAPPWKPYTSMRRLGEASKPGPTQMQTYRIAITNPTAIFSKVSTYIELKQDHKLDLITASETSATKVAQQTFQALTRSSFRNIQWSVPVQDHKAKTDGTASKRGKASGVACLTGQRLRKAMQTVPEEMASTSRILHVVTHTWVLLRCNL